MLAMFYLGVKYESMRHTLAVDVLFFVIIRRPPISTRTDTLFPYTTLFRADSVVGAAAANRGKARGRPTIAPIGPPSAARRSVAVAAMAAVAALAAIVAATAAARAVIAAEVDARLHAHQVEQVEAQPQQPGTRYLIQFALFEERTRVV